MNHRVTQHGVVMEQRLFSQPLEQLIAICGPQNGIERIVGTESVFAAERYGQQM